VDGKATLHELGLVTTPGPYWHCTVDDAVQLPDATFDQLPQVATAQVV
jgi:hypothetical protein